MAYRDFEVHSYFINIDVGDGAVHLLLERNTVVSAVLIDGGRSPAKTALKQAITTLQAQFDTFKHFTSIVITHWDGDHYHALLEMIDGDMRTGQIIPEYIDKDNTTFYCAATCWSKIKNPAGFDIKDNDNSDGKELYYGAIDKSQPIRVCKAVFSTHCLGYDLFTGKSIDGDVGLKGGKPVELLAQCYDRCEALKGALRPVFLCIGVDGIFITGKGFGFNQEIQDTKWVPPKPGWEKDPGNSKTMNASSIMATIIWPTEDPASDNRISLYTGGDVEEEGERVLIKWMKGDKDPPVPKCALDAVKAGHHGSHFATPEQLVEFGNQGFIYSAGCEYGHPSFAVILLLLLVAQHSQANSQPFSRIYGTRAPYWLTMALPDLMKGSHFNLGRVLGYSKDASKYWAVIKSLGTVDGMLDKLQYLAFMMKNYYYLTSTAKKFTKLEELNDGESIFASLQNWTMPDTSSITAEDEYMVALEGARDMVKVNWHTYGKPLHTSAYEVIFVVMVAKATAPVAFEVVPDPSRLNVVPTIKPTTSTGKTRKKDKPSPKGKSLFMDPATSRSLSGIGPLDEEKWRVNTTSERHQSYLKRQKLDGVPSKRVPSSDSVDIAIEKWTLKVFIDELKEKGGLPPTMQRFPLAGPSSPCCQWLSNCLADSSVTLFFDGTVASDGSVTLGRIDLEIAIAPSVLAFTTAMETRVSQFGEVTADKPFVSSLQGIVFALDTAKSGNGGALSLSDFARLMHHPLPGPVSDALGKLMLRPSSGTVGPDKTKTVPRSGLWFIPYHRNRTILRLAMEPSGGTGSVAELEALLKDGLGGSSLQVTGVGVYGTCACESLLDTHLEAVSTLSLQATLAGVDAGDALAGFSSTIVLKLSETAVELTLDFSQSSNSVELAGLLQRFEKKLFGGGGKESADAATQLGDLIKSEVKPDLWYMRGVSIILSPDDNQKMKPVTFRVNLEVSVPGGDGKNAPFIVAVQYQAGGRYKISAQLWRKPRYGDIPAELHPYHEEFIEFKPWKQNSVDSISLSKLIGQGGDLAQLPSGIPDTVDDARASLSYDHGHTTISLAIDLQCGAPQVSEDQSSVPPPLWFDDLKLAVALDFQKGSAKPELSLTFDAAVTLFCAPSYQEEHPEAETATYINAQVQYETAADGSYWTVQGEVDDLKVAHLFELFAADGSDSAIMELMAEITIEHAVVLYEYHSGQPSSVKITGSLLLGPDENPVRLALAYSHSKADNNGWSFNAVLDHPDDSRNFKMADLLAGLVHDESELPDMVRNLEIPLSAMKLELACSSTTTTSTTAAGGAEKHAVFALTFDAGESFFMTFAQVRSYGPGTGGQPVPIPEGTPPPPSGPGRVLRFSLSKLPDVHSIPVVGKIPQPFDQLGVVWASRDITAQELEVLNREVFVGPHTLLVEPVKPAADSTAQTPTAAAMAAGLHFQVSTLEQDAPKLVLDYVVGASKKTADDKGSSTGKDTGGQSGGDNNSGNKNSEGKNKADTDANTPSPPPSSVAPMAKTFGPLSVRNIGLSVQGTSTLVISLDATVQLGPVAFTLLDFAIAIDLAKAKTLESFKSLASAPSIHGMSVTLDRPPTTKLEGSLLHFDDGTSSGFVGTIAVSFKAWSAIAAGVYEKLDAGGLESVFVFAAVQGPIADLGCVEINGLAGGYGHNSHLTLPGIEQVSDFPFLTMINDPLPDGGGVQGQLKVLGGKGTVSAAQGETWFAAGIGLRAFQAIDAQALVAVTLADEPTVALLAHATAVFPKTPKAADKKAPNPNPLEHAFLLVDMAVEAVYAPSQGTIVVQAELTPRSFILSPSCSLTGGFAFAYFFAGSEHEGDWVVTIGGYHPRYTPPPYYPVPVGGRVGIQWQYDSEMHISGEAYFALTPQVAMGGGRIDAVMDRGWLRAGFSAYADFFMHFHPFAFEADVGVSVFAGVTLGTGWFAIHFGPAEFSASVSLRGPPISGEAHVHFWRWNVTICFGPARPETRALALDEFVRMVKNVPQDAKPEDAAKVPNHIVSITKGIANPPPSGAAAPGDSASGPTVIRGSHLQFQVETRFPVLSAKVGAADRQDKVHDAKGQQVVPSIYARPMQLHDSFQISYLEIRLKNTQSGELVELESKPLLKKVPPALWGQAVDSADAAADPSKSPLLEHVMGYTIDVAGSKTSQEQLPLLWLKQFNSFDVGQRVKIPNMEPVDDFEDDDRFSLAPLNPPEATSAAVALVAKARDDALAAWAGLKSRCSGGGAGRGVQPPVHAASKARAGTYTLPEHYQSMPIRGRG